MNKISKIIILTLVSCILGSCAPKSKIPTYTVTWKNWDGTVLEVDEDVRRGSYPEYNGETPTRPDEGAYYYSFSGWSPRLESIREDTEYTAFYAKKVYRVLHVYISDTSYGQVKLDSYDIPDGYQSYVRSNSTMSMSAVNKTSDVPFYCWTGSYLSNTSNSLKIISRNPDIDFTMPDSDYFLGAIWDYFDINYELDGGTNNDNNPDFYTSTSGTIQLSNPTRRGYSFVRWDLSGVKVSGDSLVQYSGKNVKAIDCSLFCGTLELTAVWKEAASYNLFVVFNNGKVKFNSSYISSGYRTSIYYGETISVSTTIDMPNIPFYGWYGYDLRSTSGDYFELISKDPAIDFTMPNMNYLLSAFWDHFDINYELDGGSNNNNNPNFYTSTSGTIQLYNPTKTRYSFVQWNLSGYTVSGNKLYSYSKQNVKTIDCTDFVGGLTLTAVWKLTL